MPISYSASSRVFKLDTAKTSYVIKIYDENYLLNLYYGAYIPDTNLSSFEKRPVSASFSLANPVITENGFAPDTAPMEYGTNGAGDFRISALSVRNASGDSVTDLRYESHEIVKGKPAISNQPSTYANDGDACETLILHTLDKVTGLRTDLYYSVFPEKNVITRRAVIINASEKPMKLERAFSLCVDLPTMDYDLISLYGRHARERYVERRPLAHGLQGVESKRGVSGHSQNPFVALAAAGASEDTGDVYGFNLVYSGNFSALAECDFNGSTRLIMGINPTDFLWNLLPGESFETPEVCMVYTPDGIGEMSRIFHRFYNNNLIRGRWKTEKRPLLINSWEGAFFDFDTEKLVAFAESAAEMGFEMLVMDDGWFGYRNDDFTSLGDWQVNEKKLPGGLKPLIERVNAAGLKFGIWYEPEMISPDSDLFRAHPDWHVHVDGREPMVGRHQYVLDVSRADVRDYIWGEMEKVLATNKIDYLKWDFNRNIADAGSAILPAEKKGEFFHRFILGTYDLMNRLVTAHPDLLFENCSGGGGRFDPAMLSFSPQIWTSDNTDAIERLPIQFGTSLCYPASTMGAHVSASRRTGYETKGNVAMWGTFGYELDPRKLTDEERAIAREQVKDYHKYYWLIRKGDLYRLISPFENPYRAAWMIVAEDKSEALFTLVTMRDEIYAHRVLKLRGLDPTKYYQEETTGEVYSGALLMNAGIVISNLARGDGNSAVLHFTEVK